MLTPISDAYSEGDEVPDWVEGWQSFVMSGYTAAEVCLIIYICYTYICVYVRWLIKATVEATRGV